jgi:abelson tyrosine-protein kinase 1
MAQQSHPLYQPQNSFKRAPVMGNRGLETRNSKRANQRKDVVNNVANVPVVGALEVQNVKRAIHRYGTLPKGARIGAYLESLRQNADGTPVQPAAAQNQQVQSNLVDPPLPVVNSGLSPRPGIKTQPQMIRSNSSGGVTMTNSATASLTKLQRHRTTTDGTMMTTFSSFRGASSPKRNALQPLADLEFPPPPLDLPPPPEEFEVNSFLDIPPPKMMQQTKDADVSNTEPSVEEASSRFGVSLRKREPSTDSCSSLGSPATNDPVLTVCPPPPPPVAPPSPAVAAHAIKEKLGKPKDVPKPLQNHVDPASLLVNELAEHMNLHQKPEMAMKPASKIPRKEEKENGIPFKAQLKKVEPKRMGKEPQKEECNNIIDFKSRLRKVDAGGEVVEEEKEKEKKPETKANNMKKTEIKIEIAAVTPPTVEGEKKELLMSEEDKRKSTGSISSLKKLWEAKDKGQPNVNNNNEQITQLSPKLTVKNGGKSENHEDNHFNNNNCVSATNQNHTNNNHVEEHPKKPAVPVKPAKFTIYATPTIQQHQKSLVESNGAPPAAQNQNSGNTNSNPSASSREGILELVQLLEYNLKNPVQSGAQWLQLSDKLNHIQSSCVVYADSAEMPPHTKFQFRELVTRVENQSNCLRSAGSKNVQDNEKLLVEVGQSLKQLSNALHR